MHFLHYRLARITTKSESSVSSTIAKSAVGTMTSSLIKYFWRNNSLKMETDRNLGKSLISAVATLSVVQEDRDAECCFYVGNYDEHLVMVFVGFFG